MPRELGQHQDLLPSGPVLELPLLPLGWPSCSRGQRERGTHPAAPTWSCTEPKAGLGTPMGQGYQINKSFAL